jgi:hypothetical protein
MVPLPLEMRDNIKQGRGMDKSSIIAKLREHESELKAAGIQHLFLHGSYARGTAIREMPDVDVRAEFAPGRRLSLPDMVAIETVSRTCWVSPWIFPRQKASRNLLPSGPRARPSLPF